MHRTWILLLLMGGASLLHAQWDPARIMRAGLRADHVSVTRFDAITDTERLAASGLRLMFRHASVGTTIDNALDCIQGTRTSPTDCRAYPAWKFDRRLWSCQARGNSGWEGKVTDFVDEVTAHVGEYEVLSFKYCYIDALDETREPCDGNNPEAIDQAFALYRDAMETLAARYPDKVFLWWTIPLTQVGQECTDSLNARIRTYAAEQGRPLIDIADIESHDTSGVGYRSSRGFEIAYKPHCGEQQPDAQACHPNWAGSIRIAKALWWMMTRFVATSASAVDEAPPASITSMQLSPQPARDVLTVDLTLTAAAPVQVRLVDVLGRVRYSQSVSAFDFVFRQSLAVHALPSGLYLCVVSSAGSTLVRSIRITR